ncbi:hypothetical protein [Streptomyces sp. NBC_00212]|uniref:hypothetical protein n=1 Tax=Streptomyces sp. NBC_00212 TaxID=2975684 RepID=UPI003251F504
MIEPSGIPQFLGNLDQLDKDISALRTDATGIRNGGKDVHSRFQALAGVYKAPEAEQLLGTTRPVMDKAETFAQNLETVADALETFSVEARPLAVKLAQLKSDALTFVDSVDGEHDWTYDEDKVNRHQALMDGVSAAESAFRDAENRAASKISAIVGGPKFMYDDGSHTSNAQTVMYGYSSDSLKHAEKLPWGTPESESHHLWEIDYFAKNYVLDGFLVGGVGDTFEGLGHLFGIGGSASEAWGGLKDVVTGIGLYTASPYEWVMDHTIGPAAPDPEEDHAKAATREFFKGLVAWDDWKDNPSKAAGVVTFNFGTGVLGGVLRGAGKAGEAGEAASKASRAATAAANLITYLDPVAAGLKIGGTAVSKMPSVAELASRIRIGSSADHIHSVWELNDGSKVVIKDGKFIPYGKDGKPITQPAPSNAKAHQPTTSDAPPGVPERHPVGVGSRTPEASAHAGENLPPQATHHAPSGGSGSGAGSHTPSGGGGSHTPSGGGDHGTGGHDHTPGTGAGGHSEKHTSGGEPQEHRGTGTSDTPGETGTTPSDRANEPLPELTAEEKAAHWGHLDEVEKRAPEEFDHLKHDPDHKGQVNDKSMDEARVGLDLRENGRIPADIRRPETADRGEFYSETTGEYYDIKGIHSDYPPFNNVRDKSQPFKGAYDPANNEAWVNKQLAKQIEKNGRIIIIDLRNANQAAIDSVKAAVESRGWGDRVIWYP